jgi:hypothetical protein
MTEKPKQNNRVAQEIEKANRWGKVKEFFFENPTLVVTLLYLYATSIGIIYSAALYRRFGINIFDYSEVGDFILAAFKNPVAFVSVGVLAAMGLAIVARTRYAVRRIWREKFREVMNEAGWEERLRQKAESSVKEDVRRAYEEGHLNIVHGMTAIIAIILALTIVFTSLILPYYSASKTASSIKAGETQTVDVRYRSFKGSAGQVTEPDLALIGATQKAVFFYDENSKRTIVIPQAQIVSVEIPE